ncbi:MAG: cytochrome c [Verrucomicrobia bacterium]|nr:cytochrome c [Verrucomicrobiota bacterium]
MRQVARILRVVFFMASLMVFPCCRRDLADQQHHEPMEASSVFPDGSASRTPPEHTLARGQLHEDVLFYQGKMGGDHAAVFPAPVTRAQLERGRERYDIFCSVCHGSAGVGDGIVVQRGFPPPPSLHLDRLRDAPPGYFFEVITQGRGLMYPYGSRVEAADRWAIIAYIRALQLSRHATLADLNAEQRKKLEDSAHE